MEVPMETCPFMSRLYLPRYLFLFCFLPFSLLSLKINVRFGLGNIYGVESKMYCLGTLMWAAPERTAGFSVYISRCCWLKQDTLSQQNWSVYFGNLGLYVKIFTEQFSICKSRCLPSSVEAPFSRCPREEAVAEMSCPGASAAKPCAQAVSSVRSTPYHVARWWIGFHISPGFSYSPLLPALLSSPLWALLSLLVCCLSCSRCGCRSWSWPWTSGEDCQVQQWLWPPRNQYFAALSRGKLPQNGHRCGGRDAPFLPLSCCWECALHVPATSSHGATTDVILETGGRKQWELGIVHIKWLLSQPLKIVCPVPTCCQLCQRFWQGRWY